MTRLISLLILAIVLLSCNSKEDKAEIKGQKVTNLGVDAPSELTVLMHTMEAKMQLIKKDIKEERKIDSTYFNDYQDIFTTSASNNVSRDSTFMHFGSDFLNQFNELTSRNNNDSITLQYNAVIKSCVTCHTTHCPGPVVRIQKLLLRP